MRQFLIHVFEQSHSGIASVITTLMVLVVILVIGLSISLDVVLEQREARNKIFSLKSYFIAESAGEDYLLRLSRGENPPASSVYSSTLFSNDGSADITLATDPQDQSVQILTMRGDVHGRARRIEIRAKKSTQLVQFFYGVQVGDGGLSMGNNAVINGNIFSNGNILGSNGAIIQGSAVVAGGITENPSDAWTTENANQFFATASVDRDIAQSFTASASGNLTKVSVFLGKVGSPSTNLTLRITDDTNGEPASSSLASATLAVSSVGATPSWIDISFPTPPNLTAGVRYWILLDATSSSGANYWNWRKDSTDAYANHTGTYTGNWGSGNPPWTNVGGDLAFRVWVGGVNTRIEDMTIGDATSGSGQANLFVNATIHGSACPNAYCIVANPSRQNLPISDGVIQDWKDAAAAGGTCAPPTCDASGDYSLTNNGSATLGPLKVNGNFLISNGATLTINGTIWVTGDITLSNDCIVNLSPAYSAFSGVILADGDVVVSNNCAFQGSGVSGSYVMLLTDKNVPASEVMTVSNNSAGVVYYASNGRIRFQNNATAKEATAYGITMDNNSAITYESGLANANFSSGPGAGMVILQWREL
ncbi:MAG: hypothetical protein HY460_00730 [Parcubacteria group bacterium]|nr:hypothetical protein [Parcubacteria group bacterium]